MERVHGGARAIAGAGGSGHGPDGAVDDGAPLATAWTQRLAEARAAKAVIAAHVARQVDHGSTIFLDASSSVFALARRLAEEPPHDLTVVTNSPAVAFEVEASAIHIIVCPGELDQHMRMLTGRWTMEFLAELNFDVAFVSAAGITLGQGLTTSRRPLADVVNTARASAERCVGLIDASKFGRASLLSIVPAGELDSIVTDPAIAPDVVREYQAAGVRLEIARTEEEG